MPVDEVYSRFAPPSKKLRWKKTQSDGNDNGAAGTSSGNGVDLKWTGAEETSLLSLGVSRKALKDDDGSKGKQDNHRSSGKKHKRDRRGGSSADDRDSDRERSEKHSKHRKRENKHRESRDKKKSERDNGSDSGEMDVDSLWVVKGDEVEDENGHTSSPKTSLEPKPKREDWMLAPPTPSEAPHILLPDTDQGGLKRSTDSTTSEGPKIVRLGHDPNASHGASPSQPPAKPKEIEFGDAGSGWRMMKLRKCYEIAEEEGKDVREVALSRYGSEAAFQQALDERAFLEKHPKAGMQFSNSDFGGGRQGHVPRDRDREWASRPQSTSFGSFSGGREKFKRPDDHRETERRILREDGDRYGQGRRDVDDATPRSTTNTSAGASSNPANGVSNRSGLSSSGNISGVTRAVERPAPAKPVWPPPGLGHLLSKPSPPLSSSASVSAPPSIPLALQRSPAPASGTSIPILSTADLNKLSSRVLRAKLSKDPTYPELQAQLDRERARAAEAPQQNPEVVVISPYDPKSGALRDIGRASTPDVTSRNHHNRPRSLHKPETASATLGDDESITQMALRERMARDVQDDGYDSALFGTIAGDKGWKDTVEHLEDEVDKVAEDALQGVNRVERERTDEQKRRRAVQECGSCVLALSGNAEIAPGQCLIVPREHVRSCLEMEEGGWEEVRNFMKSLIRMFSQHNLSVVFTETVIQLRRNKHTVIECFPIPTDLGVARAHFQEGILQAEGEWQQHKKLIETGPRGFRRSMVKNLPYFHVWFDPTNGYGHVIEDPESFPQYFGKEILAGVLELTPDQYRRPRRLDMNPQINDRRTREWKKKWSWDNFDWTRELQAADGGN
ncbi:hypothetical protein HDU93_008084 [Gonapodya sp. JEL0774]|nr:hypothetical protein HDU93_008084 [Gonapodya sp. JEL0774]